MALFLARDVAAATSCTQLRALALSDATIDAAEDVAAHDDAFYAPRAFCRVLVTIAPTPDSDIKAEVWLPSAGWNGKFQAVGNSDAAGAISYDDMIDALRAGYATSSTDTGHVGNSMAFAMGHPEKYIDFGYRAVHEMTIAAKAIVEAFYGAMPAHAYWNGCSQGGRQGVTEAMRFPADYDGIIAGAPAIGHMRLHAARLALNRFVNRATDSAIPPAKYPALHRAAVTACDALDGVVDGLIGNPPACRFDPGVLACTNGDDVSCLTPSQVQTARGLYAPIVDASSGHSIAAPLLQPGSELGWARLAGPEPLINAVEPFKYVVFQNPEWNWRTFSLSTDLPRALEIDAGIIDRLDPNLASFFEAGGKLLLYHGWADPQVPALATIAYFNEVLQTTGESRRGTAIELYLEPGVTHCSGGDGPDQFDAVSALDEWVRSGRAPARITASHMSGETVDRTRPLCPYPLLARYAGHGTVDAAENFVCTPDAASGSPLRAGASDDPNRPR